MTLFSDAPATNVAPRPKFGPLARTPLLPRLKGLPSVDLIGTSPIASLAGYNFDKGFSQTVIDGFNLISLVDCDLSGSTWSKVQFNSYQTWVSLCGSDVRSAPWIQHLMSITFYDADTKFPPGFIPSHRFVLVPTLLGRDAESAHAYHAANVEHQKSAKGPTMITLRVIRYAALVAVCVALTPIISAAVQALL